VHVQRADADRPLLPPVSLAELFQNALKHSTVTADRPLLIQVRIEDDTLVVENNLRSGIASARSTGMGLTNMRERFRLATGRSMVWGPNGIGSSSSCHSSADRTGIKKTLERTLERER
jgi:hypothetical protein